MNLIKTLSTPIKNVFIHVYADEINGLPWNENDCHGIITQVRNNHAKLPGEVFIYKGGWNECSYIYDIPATIEKFRKGYKEADYVKGWRQKMAESIRNDVEWCRKFLDGQIECVGLTLSCEGVETSGLWGYYYDNTDSSENYYLIEAGLEQLAELKEMMQESADSLHKALKEIEGYHVG